MPETTDRNAAIAETRAQVAFLAVKRGEFNDTPEAVAERVRAAAFAHARGLARRLGAPHAELVKAITPSAAELDTARAKHWAKDLERQEQARDAAAGTPTPAAGTAEPAGKPATKPPAESATKAG